MSSIIDNVDIKRKAYSENQNRNNEGNQKIKISKSNTSASKISQEENIKNLKKNLLEGSYESKIIELFEKENKYYSDLIKPNNILDESIIKNDSKFDDEIFEEKVNQIFVNEFNLELLDLFPYFEVVNSKKKYKKVTQISYFKIECNCSTDKKNLCYYFLYNRDIFIFNFQDLTIYLSKSEGLPSNIAVILKNFGDYREFKLNKNGKIYELSFQYKDITPELIKVLNLIKNLQEKKEKNSEEEKRIEILQNIKKMLEKKYDEKEINSKKLVNQNEILLLEEKIKYNEIIKASENVRELKEQKALIEEKIKEYDTLLKKITIKIEKVEKELDGFYISTNDITLSNSIDDNLIIPKNSPIIVEVKNNFNYQKIIDNLKEKKKIIKLLGLEDDSFYFVGILRGIKITKIEKLIIQNNIKDFNFKNTIIIYPEKMKFFGQSLIKQKLNTDQNNDIQEINLEISNIKLLLVDMQKKLDQLTKKMDEKEIKKKINFEG